MATTAVAVVALATVTGPNPPDGPPPTATPAPKLATVVPCIKCVNCPVTATDRLCWPGCPALGFNCVSDGGPLVTVKPLVNVTTSVSVVRMTVRDPTATAGLLLPA